MTITIDEKLVQQSGRHWAMNIACSSDTTVDDIVTLVDFSADLDASPHAPKIVPYTALKVKRITFP